MKKLGMMFVAGLGLASASPAQALEFITNGNFTTGLTGWTTYNTVNGTSSPTTTSFNVTGLGANSALRLRAGQATFQGFGSTARGGGVYQMVNVTFAATYTFSADYATTAPGNLSGGIFSLMMNDVAVTNFDTGQVTGTERGSLVYSVNLAPGLYKIGVQVARPFTSTGSSNQYFDNVRLVAPTPVGYVPEPGTWMLMLAGFGLAGGMMRRQKIETRVRFS